MSTPTGARPGTCCDRRLALGGLLGLCLGWVLPGAAAAADPALVQFTVPAAEPTALQSLLGERAAAAPPPRRLAGWYLRPAGAPPHPALVLLPDCRGTLDYQRDWARRLSDWGYLTLLLDYPAAEAAERCNRPYGSAGHRWTLQLPYDAHAALAFLAARPEVDHLRVGLLGWARHGVLEAVLRDGVQQFHQRRFKVAVAFGPDCTAATSARFFAPVLILAGGRDDWSPPANCQRLADRARGLGRVAELALYPQARHGFDDPGAAGGLWLAGASNPHLNPALGASLEYDAEATTDARRRVSDFLERQLRYSPFRGSLDDLPTALDPAAVAAARWAVDPAQPGPDLPPLGGSTFDRLFSRSTPQGRVHDIPFPFERLVERIARQVPAGEPLLEPVSAVLIPRGRSLQREVAAPDYFRYPRVVVGVVREPLEDGRGRRLLLKDRLFVAYVEKSATLEVISYNPWAGRFEYQLVRDYAAGREPQVFYAPRQLCLACHQNQAPIFPNAPWDETNASREIMAALRAVQDRYYGLPALALGNSANNLDRAANRANLFAVHDLLWRELCASDDPAAGARCRAALLRAALQFRLSDGTGFEGDGGPLAEDFAPLAAANWQTRWPHGLLVPAANHPDRDPIELLGAVPVRLDPLTPRAPEFLWRWSDPQVLHRLVASLGERLLGADLERLDAWLQQASRGVAERLVEARCSAYLDRQRGLAHPLRLSCRDEAGAEVLRAALGRSAAEGGSVDWLSPRPGVGLQALDLAALPGNGEARSYALWPRRGSLSARTPEGWRLQRLDLVPDGAQEFRMRLALREEFATLDRALAQMARAADSALRAGAGPVDPQALSAELFARLGLAYPSQCCEAAGALPPARAEPNLVVEGADDPLLRGLGRYCGACHATAGPVPPPFLAGGPERVHQNLRRCAARINYRLGMWQVEPQHRGASPMPPVPPPPYAAQSWTDSPAFAALRRAAAELLEPGAARLERLLARPYEQLPACAPLSAEAS